MTDFLLPTPALDAVAAGIAGAGADRKQQQDDAEKTAAAISAAFDKAGDSIAKSLAKAASDGKVSLAELASVAVSALESFGKTAVAGAGGGLDGLGAVLGSLTSSLFSGAKADGGPVTPGGAYLVGERGPEVFRPATAGDITPAGGGAGAVVNVTIAGGGAPQLLRSEAQIAAALARAVALGAR